MTKSEILQELEESLLSFDIADILEERIVEIDGCKYGFRFGVTIEGVFKPCGMFQIRKVFNINCHNISLITKHIYRDLFEKKNKITHQSIGNEPSPTFRIRRIENLEPTVDLDFKPFEKGETHVIKRVMHELFRILYNSYERIAITDKEVKIESRYGDIISFPRSAKVKDVAAIKNSIDKNEKQNILKRGQAEAILEMTKRYSDPRIIRSYNNIKRGTPIFSINTCNTSTPFHIEKFYFEECENEEFIKIKKHKKGKVQRKYIDDLRFLTYEDTKAYIMRNIDMLVSKCWPSDEESVKETSRYAQKLIQLLEVENLMYGIDDKLLKVR